MANFICGVFASVKTRPVSFIALKNEFIHRPAGIKIFVMVISSV